MIARAVGLSRSLRGAVLVLLVVAGLGLMHSGVGPGAGCHDSGASGDAMAGMAHPTSATGAGGARDERPAQPVAAHAGAACASTPASDHAADLAADPGLRVVRVGRLEVTPVVATGRRPPAPDPVSVLGVDRR